MTILLERPPIVPRMRLPVVEDFIEAPPPVAEDDRWEREIASRVVAARPAPAADAPLFDCFWLFYVSIVGTLVAIGLVSTFAMFIVACMAGFGGVR